MENLDFMPAKTQDLNKIQRILVSALMWKELVNHSCHLYKKKAEQTENQQLFSVPQRIEVIGQMAALKTGEIDEYREPQLTRRIPGADAHSWSQHW